MNDLAPPPDPPSRRSRRNYGILVLQTFAVLVVGGVTMIYYSGLTTSSAPEAIVIEHLVPYAKKRVVGKIGGHVKILQAD